MDKSTENVTLIAAFITDILDLYQGKADYVKLKQMSSHLDLTDPMRHVPIDTYNEMCNWIESEIGQANTRMLGRKFGETAYQSM